MRANPIRVGILGLGRSGYAIHSVAIRAMPEHYIVTAVHDPINARSDECASELGATSYPTVEALLDDPKVELVVVATPNALHCEHTIAALRAGKHVLCEKPFGLTTGETDRMIAASKEVGRILQPFQQRRYEADFRTVKEICDSGLLGEIHYIRICWHGFKRRWDWQTSQAKSGGALNNNGPHPIDHALELFGPSEPSVACEMRKVLSSGDAEDFLRIELSGSGAPTIAIELIDCAAYPYERWWIAGSSGGLRGNAKSLEWKWVDWSQMPERPLDYDPTKDRSYNNEPLTWQSDSWEAEAAPDVGAGGTPAQTPALALYDDLHQTIRNGKPQAITPESVRRRVEVIEKARAASGFYGG